MSNNKNNKSIQQSSATDDSVVSEEEGADYNAAVDSVGDDIEDDATEEDDMEDDATEEDDTDDGEIEEDDTEDEEIEEDDTEDEETEEDDTEDETVEIEMEDAEEAAAVERLFEICKGESSFTTAELEEILEKYPNSPKRLRNCNDRTPAGSLFYSQEEYFETLPRLKYPLHIACRTNAPISVIRALLMAWPKAIKMRVKDYLKRRTYFYLPFHEACHCSKSLATIQLLLETWPKAKNISAERNRNNIPYYPF